MNYANNLAWMDCNFILLFLRLVYNVYVHIDFLSLYKFTPKDKISYKIRDK